LNAPRFLEVFIGPFNLKDRKLFCKLFLSFIAIGLVPILIMGSLTYGKLFNILRQHVISSNIAYMDQGKNSLGAYLRQIHGMRAQLSTNKNVNSFFLKKNGNRVEILFYIKTIIDEINKYGVAANEITDVLAIYFPENNVVVTNKTFYEGESFFNEFRKYGDMDSSKCFEKLSETETREYWEAKTVFDEYNMPKRVVTCIQALPMYSKKYGYLITMIDEGKLWNLFGKGNTEGWENYKGIVNKNGQLVASSDPENIPDIVNGILDSLPKGGSGYINAKDEHGTTYIVTYTAPDENDWRYFGIIHEEMIMKRISSVRTMYIGALVIETADELAVFSYLVYKPGIDAGLHDWLVEGFGKGLSSLHSCEDERVGKILDAIKNAMTEKAAGRTENYMLMPLLHLLAGRHLSGLSGDYGYLERLGVAGGYDGLDFSDSSFCAEGTGDINIVVRYTVRIPVPLRIFGDLHFEQKARVRAWMGGDNPFDKTEDIWSLDNFTRGRKIREIFGANLPWGFPGISSFKNGCAILIRSMDITVATYQEPGNIERTVNGYIDYVQFVAEGYLFFFKSSEIFNYDFFKNH
jgi:hypothetical protein